MIEERVRDARRRAEADVPVALRHVMAERWGRINYSELSRRAGVPVSTVRNHVAGHNPIPTHDLAAYAAALGVPTWLLFASTDEALAWVRSHPDDGSADTLTRTIGGYSNSERVAAAAA